MIPHALGARGPWGEEQKGDRGEGRRSPREGLDEQEAKGKREGDPRPRDILGGGRGRLWRPLVGVHQIANGAGLIAQRRGDERALRGIGNDREHVVASARVDHVPVQVFLEARQHPGRVAERNAGGVQSSLSDQNQVNPLAS